MKKTISMVMALIMLITALGATGTTAFAKSSNTISTSQNIILSKWHICTLVEYKQPTCTKDGYKKYKCRLCSYTKKVNIKATGHKYEKYLIKATPESDGACGSICSVCKDEINHVTINKPAEIRLSADKFTYTGKEIKPDVKVYDSKGNCIDSDEYIAEYADNVSVGTAKVIVRFNSDKYEGELKAFFTISKPSAEESTTASSAKASITLKNARPKGFTISFAVTPSVKQYQIQYSLGPTFQTTNTKTITKAVKVSNESTVSYTATNLQPSKTYYVRVRLNKNGIYSAWSAMKTIKINNY